MSLLPLGKTAKGKIIGCELAMANRHGLIAGATGTGKTVTLQRFAEQLSGAGVSVFTTDVKGDLSGIAIPARENPKLAERVAQMKMENFTPHENPVIFWDIYGQNGHPLRTTISDMGPLLFGRLLNLNETQQGILNAVFRIADDQGLLLLDLKDLRSLLNWVGDNSDSLKTQYGNITTASVGTIQRGLLTLAEAGGDIFFGEPAFKIENLFQRDASGKGVISILDATKLINDGRLYSTFLLWLLSELFENLPEVGDQDKPRLVFFFDEAHLMFNAAPKPLLEKIEQLVRLIRSKGVGVYFVTQNPLDVPETVLGQLGNRVQHALRAFTPKDQKALKAAADTFRKNPALDVETVLQELGVGEALVSMLDTTGTPNRVERVKIYPPESNIGPLTPGEHLRIVQQSPFYGIYDKSIDRESAYEVLNKRLSGAKAVETETIGTAEAETVKQKPGRPRDTLTESIMKSTARSIGSSIGSQVGRQIIRGILGSIFGKK